MKKNRNESLIVENHKLMATILELKQELSQARVEKESVRKNVRMLNIGQTLLKEFYQNERLLVIILDLVFLKLKGSPTNNLNLKGSRRQSLEPLIIWPCWNFF